MGQQVEITAADGHKLSAYVAEPDGQVLGALVVVQEIFGVNDHIRRVTDSFAKEGYRAIAPALFDRTEKGVELRYEGADMQKAVQLMHTLKPETALLDIAAAFEHVSQSGSKGAVVGFCYGGFMAWLSATRGRSVGFQPACAVGYYPGGIGSVAAEEPACPVLLHFGGDDSHIGPEQIAAVHAAHDGHSGEVQVFVYPGAEHGFNCDARASFNPSSSAEARERTLRFLREHLA